VTGFDSEEGQVLIALFLDPTGWPADSQAAFAALTLPIRDGRTEARIDEVPAGPFALSVIHDRDRDGELDKGAFGIPSEDYGFSRNARGTLGPPSFEEARLDLKAGQSMQVTIDVK